MIDLEVRNLAKWFEEKKVVLDVPELNVKSSRLCFLGENGSGKTTMLSIIAGLVRPSRGSLMLNGFEPYNNREKVSKLVSYVFEKPKMAYRLKVKEFVKFLSNYKRDLSNDFEEIIEILGIREFYEKKLYELSSGQEQLVYLLTALSRNTSIVVTDEAFSHIDLSRVGRIINYMEKMRKDLIFSTHVPEEAEALADYIVILKDGRVVWKGSIDELYHSDIYEVYAKRNAQLGVNILFKFGNILLVNSNKEELLSLLEEGKIYGFRKAGVRKIYGNKSN